LSPVVDDGDNSKGSKERARKKKSGWVTRGLDSRSGNKQAQGQSRRRALDTRRHHSHGTVSDASSGIRNKGKASLWALFNLGRLCAVAATPSQPVLPCNRPRNVWCFVVPSLVFSPLAPLPAGRAEQGKKKKGRQPELPSATSVGSGIEPTRGRGRRFGRKSLSQPLRASVGVSTSRRGLSPRSMDHWCRGGRAAGIRDVQSG
jgi:hypothetical protein